MTARADKFKSAKELLFLVESAVNLLRLYARDHPRAQEAVEQAWYGALAHLKRHGRIVYDFEYEQIFFEGSLMVDESVACTEVISALERGHGNRLIFEQGLTRELLADFLSLLAEVDADGSAENREAVSLRDRMKYLDLGQVEVKRMSRRMIKKKAAKRSVGGREALYLKYGRAIADLSTLFDDVRSGRSLNPAKTRAVAAWVANATGRDRDSALALTALRNRDEYLCHHSLNVALFSSALGRSIGVQEDDIEALVFAALLHDVGKATLPANVLKKPGTLSSEEWVLMTGHPEDGARLINERLEGETAAMVVAFEHHLGADLSGYPRVTGDWHPHIFSRVVQVADVYDGMTADRSYRRPKLRSEAVALILGDLAHLFEPALVRLFFQILGVYPIGSVIRLSSGETALVRGVDPDDLRRPIVKTLTDAPGRLLRLAEDSSISIEEVVDAGAAGVDLSHALCTD